MPNLLSECAPTFGQDCACCAKCVYWNTWSRSDCPMIQIKQVMQLNSYVHICGKEAEFFPSWVMRGFILVLKWLVSFWVRCILSKCSTTSRNTGNNAFACRATQSSQFDQSCICSNNTVWYSVMHTLHHPTPEDDGSKFWGFRNMLHALPCWQCWAFSYFEPVQWHFDSSTCAHLTHSQSRSIYNCHINKQ